MSRWTLVLFLLPAVFGADDEWNKVRELKSGTELRIIKRRASQPVLAVMDEASDESLIVVVKNEQTAIPKGEIERIDYRPKQTGSRVTKETKTTTETPEARQGTPKPTGSASGSSSYSSSVNVGGKPDFETIYRRKAGVEEKEPVAN